MFNSLPALARSSNESKATKSTRNVAPRAARIALSLNGSHVPGSKATVSQPNATAVRVSVPKFPGSCTPSTASTRTTSLCFAPSTNSRAFMITGDANSPTASNPSALFTPAHFFSTLAGARITLFARIPCRRLRPLRDEQRFRFAPLSRAPEALAHEHARRQHHRPALVPVRLALAQLCKVLHRRVLRARHALDAVGVGGGASNVSRVRTGRSRARRAERGVFIA